MERRSAVFSFRRKPWKRVFIRDGAYHRLLVSEITIPEPAVSDNVAELPAAETIQPFADIFGGLYDGWYTEIPRVGLEILNDRIYFCRGEHFQHDGNPMSHGYASLGLTDPESEGLWTVGGMDDNYATNDYLFKIPEEWSMTHAPGYAPPVVAAVSIYISIHALRAESDCGP